MVHHCVMLFLASIGKGNSKRSEIFVSFFTFNFEFFSQTVTVNKNVANCALADFFDKFPSCMSCRGNWPRLVSLDDGVQLILSCCMFYKNTVLVEVLRLGSELHCNWFLSCDQNVSACSAMTSTM